MGDGAAGRLDVRVSTIDGFQGQEADLVILSTVRGSAGAGSNSGGVGFLADIRRMNVLKMNPKRELLKRHSHADFCESQRYTSPRCARTACNATKQSGELHNDNALCLIMTAIRHLI